MHRTWFRPAQSEVERGQSGWSARSPNMAAAFTRSPRFRDSWASLNSLPKRMLRSSRDSAAAVSSGVVPVPAVGVSAGGGVPGEAPLPFCHAAQPQMPNPSATTEATGGNDDNAAFPGGGRAAPPPRAVPTR